jgi:REP element-mobilizing transposase RayT
VEPQLTPKATPARRGRPRTSRFVPHRRRPSHSPECAMHMTVRRRDGLPSFRKQRVLDLVHDLMREKNDDSFQIVYHSIQSNHIHFIGEARDRRALTRAMQGFMIAFAKRLNAMLKRKGKVWADRYYARDIVGSREMRNVLSYVFHNAKKHGALEKDSILPDLFSNAVLFDGWQEKFLIYGFDDWPKPKPRTRMLRSWWRGHAPLSLAGPRAGDASHPRASRSA